MTGKTSRVEAFKGVDTRRAYVAIINNGKEIARLSLSDAGSLESKFDFDLIFAAAARIENEVSERASEPLFGVGEFGLPDQLAYLLDAAWREGVTFGRMSMEGRS